VTDTVFDISEVCEMTGVASHVLRYWESEFPALAPLKNDAGRRIYSKRDVEVATRIKGLLYDEQLTIAGARQRLAAEYQQNS
jgi:DNA-binding transcriptional MerR regulator